MNLTITASGFSITIPGFENAIENTIAAAIGTDKQVTLVDDFDDVPEPWILTISNGSLTKEFVCRIGCNGQNLTIDQSQIIFG